VHPRWDRLSLAGLRALAIPSFIIPIRPLGSAAETAIPAMIGLCRSSFHSSDVKSVFAAMVLLRANVFALKI
jgi:hypothetical protein